MKRWWYWIVVGVVLLAVAALIGWGSVYIPPLTASASEEWSRGRILGVMPVNTRVDVQPVHEGGVVISWVDLNDRLHVAQVGARGQVMADRTPALWADVPRDPLLLVGPAGEIHLIWRETGEDHPLLAYAQLNRAASVQVDPFVILPGDNAQSPNMAFNRQGEIEIFWSGQGGVYQTTLSAAGEMQSKPILLVEDGEQVSVQVDPRGVFHLVWMQRLGANEAGIYYAFFDPGQRELSQTEEMVRLFLRPGQTVQTLDIGMDIDNGYVLWVIQDMKNVVSNAQYAFFPLEIPRQKKVRDLELGVGGNPLSLRTLRGQHEMLLVALTETIMTEDGPQLQIGVITLHGEQTPGDQARAATGSRGPGSLRMVDSGFEDGSDRSSIARRPSLLSSGDWPEGQYLVTASERPSLRPSPIIDTQGNLHLTWLESGGFGMYQVAYASTASEVKEVYNRPTWWDITDRALSLAMQFFLAVGLTPVLAIYWSLIPLGWLLLYLFITGHEHLTTFRTWAAWGISVLLEIASTYLIYPHRSRMPAAFQWSAPLVTAAVGLLLALLYLRRRDEKPLFGAFFVFAIVHGVLQVGCFVLVR
jgi:hypothetical protein